MNDLAIFPECVNLVETGRRRAILAIAAALSVLWLGLARPAEACSRDFRIALDVGHTLARPGAISARGTPELEYNLRLASAIDRRLREQAVPTVLIKEGGRPMSLTERTAIATRAGASVFLSIHHDSVQPRYLSTWRPDGKPLRYTDLFSGYSLFVSVFNSAFEDSVRLAELLGDEMLGSGQAPSMHHAEPIVGEGRPLLDRARGIYRFDGLAVLRTARMPAVLLEAAIIVNRRDEDNVRSPEGLERTVAAVARAVLSYCGSPKRPPSDTSRAEESR